MLGLLDIQNLVLIGKIGLLVTIEVVLAQKLLRKHANGRQRLLREITADLERACHLTSVSRVR